jgi:PTH1 family peptidyl-tRNA hydrolase
MAARAEVKLLVGLGNPGTPYLTTRHNAGFWFLDQVALRLGVRFRSDPRCQADTATADQAGGALYLLKPMCFMNRSGHAVGAFARYHKVSAEQILVAHDDLDFEPGVVRLKVGGGHGGHNGLRDIIAVLGDAGFARLRFGIGRPSDRRPTADYVLSKPPEEDERAIHDAIQRTLERLPSICAADLTLVMNQLNT